MNQETTKLIPNHIGFIVDGNRRWARERGLPTLEGHKRGFDVLWDMAYIAKDKGVKYVSAYIFSTENWNRSQEEVSYLMDLFRYAFKHRMKQLIKDNFRILFLGRRNNVAADITEAICEAEELSKNNTGTTLALHFNYGGHAEFIDAACHLAADVQSGRTSLAEMTDERFREYLYHPELPDLDMMVRTSGEQRLSGFMLWRIAYAELMFLDKKWPDMTEQDIDDIIDEFNHRHRRYGR